MNDYAEQLCDYVTTMTALKARGIFSPYAPEKASDYRLRLLSDYHATMNRFKAEIEQRLSKNRLKNWAKAKQELSRYQKTVFWQLLNLLAVAFCVEWHLNAF